MTSEHSPKLGIPDAEKKLRERFSNLINWDIARDGIKETCLGCEKPINPTDAMYYSWDVSVSIFIHDQPVCIQKALEIPLIYIDKLGRNSAEEKSGPTWIRTKDIYLIRVALYR